MFQLLRRIMSTSSLSPAAVQEVNLLNSKLTSIRAEIRSFVDLKNSEINEIQRRIDSLITTSSGVKRPVSVDSEAPNKKIKTDPLSLTVKDGFTQVYTDGACPSNGHGAAKAGIGVWWADGHSWNLSRRVTGDKQTNNVAEIQAASMAVSLAMDNGVKRLQVNTDSQFVINCITKWVANWKKNGWKTAAGKPVVNKEDLVELDRLVGSGKVDIKWAYVKGHSDNYGNNQADKLAVAGSKM